MKVPKPPAQGLLSDPALAPKAPAGRPAALGGATAVKSSLLDEVEGVLGRVRIGDIPLAKLVETLEETYGRVALRAAVKTKIGRREPITVHQHALLWGLVAATKMAMGLRSITDVCDRLSTMMPAKDRMAGGQLRARYNRATVYLRRLPDYRREAEDWRDEVIKGWRASGRPFPAHARGRIADWLTAAEQRKQEGRPERRPLPRPRSR